MHSAISRERPKSVATMHVWTSEFFPNFSGHPLWGLTHPYLILYRSIQNTISRERPKRLATRHLWTSDLFLQLGSHRSPPLGGKATATFSASVDAQHYFKEATQDGSHETSLDFRNNCEGREPSLLGAHPTCTPVCINQFTVLFQRGDRRR